MLNCLDRQTGDVMYAFDVFCPDNYPAQPPQITIKEPKLAMAAVDSKGMIISSLSICTRSFLLRRNGC